MQPVDKELANLQNGAFYRLVHKLGEPKIAQTIVYSSRLFVTKGRSSEWEEGVQLVSARVSSRYNVESWEILPQEVYPLYSPQLTCGVEVQEAAGSEEVLVTVE